MIIAGVAVASWLVRFGPWGLVLEAPGNRSFYSCLLGDLALVCSEAGGDLVLIQTSLLLLCKSSCSYAN